MRYKPVRTSDCRMLDVGRSCYGPIYLDYYYKKLVPPNFTAFFHLEDSNILFISLFKRELKISRSVLELTIRSQLENNIY